MANRVLEHPQPTSNAISDIIGWIKSGDCVILQYKNLNRYIYHNCENTSLDHIRVIYLDLYRYPDLLDKDEWPYYIEEKGNCKKCSCAVKEEISKVKAPYEYHFSM